MSTFTRKDYFLPAPHGGRGPGDVAVRQATHRYVLQDYNKKGQRYSDEDQVRVHELLMKYRGD